MTPRRETATATVALAVGLAVLAGCGEDTASSDDRPEAQPAPDVSVFAEGGFDELPLPPRADPVGPRSEDADVVARSFTVRNTTPQEVIQFYEGQLVGWTSLGTETAGTVVRSDYERDGRGLRITVQPAPAVGDDVPHLQLSLQLGPPGQVFVG